MSEEIQQAQRVRVVCRECPFSKVVDSDGEASSQTIIEHGRETGHTLFTETVEDQ